jgi:hypothetical protein
VLSWQVDGVIQHSVYELLRIQIVVERGMLVGFAPIVPHRRMLGQFEGPAHAPVHGPVHGLENLIFLVVRHRVVMKRVELFMDRRFDGLVYEI